MACEVISTNCSIHFPYLLTYFDLPGVQQFYHLPVGIVQHTFQFRLKQLAGRYHSMHVICSFESSNEKSDRVSKACRQIQLTHHSKPAYQHNVSVAYDILCQNKGDNSRNCSRYNSNSLGVVLLAFATTTLAVLVPRVVARNLLKRGEKGIWGWKSRAGSRGEGLGWRTYGCRLYRKTTKIQNIPILKSILKLSQ